MFGKNVLSLQSKMQMNMANTELIKKIEKKFGRQLRYSQECEPLVEAIYEETGERLGVSTLKRLFGFVGQVVVPRTSTMDIIAQYIGYPNYELLLKDMENDSDISAFSPVDEIDVAEIQTGTQIQLTYDPNRLIVMTYLGNSRFIVNESQNCKLQKGDIVRITHLAVGFDLLASEVVRDGNNIGPYHAAKQGGLTSLEIII